MSVALDTTTTEPDKTAFDAEFETDAPEQTAGDEEICNLTCNAAVTIF